MRALLKENIAISGTREVAGVIMMSENNAVQNDGQTRDDRVDFSQ